MEPVAIGSVIAGHCWKVLDARIISPQSRVFSETNPSSLSLLLLLSSPRSLKSAAVAKPDRAVLGKDWLLKIEAAGFLCQQFAN